MAVDPRIIVEDKGSSLAVHYRLAPERGPLIKNKIAAILDRAPAEKLELLCGKAVIEIKPPSFNKGVAVCELMKSPPFAQRTPLFVGDDVTDESVFAVLPALGGFGYSVGRDVAGVEGTFAGPQDVRDWLTGLCGRDGMKWDERFRARSCDHRQWAHGSAGGPIVADLGRREQAREMFNDALRYRNRYGLLAEDIHPRTGELWGNFPQTYSMAGLILTAMQLSR